MLAIATLGVVEIYSATRNTVWEGAHLKQLLWIGLGLILLWTVSRIDYKTLVDQAPVFYAIAVVLLVGVELFGSTFGGAKRWLPLPAGVHLQISEFVKVVLVLLVAWFFMGSSGRPVPPGKTGSHSGAVWGARGPGTQTTGSEYGSQLSADPRLGRVSRRCTMETLGCSGSTRFAGRADRLAPDATLSKGAPDCFCGPGTRPQRRGLSIDSVKNRGRGGRHMGSGLRPRLADAVALSAGSAYGFYLFGLRRGGGFRRSGLGSGALLRCFDACGGQCTDGRGYDRDAYLYGRGRLLLFHLVVNVGMVIGQMPVTGLPLPLMSYGGSNALTTFLLFGLVINVRLRRFTN